MPHLLEGSVTLQPDERPGLPGLYALHLKVTTYIFQHDNLLAYAANMMAAGKMQAPHFNDMMMQAFKVLGVKRIREVVLHVRVKDGRQNVARLVMEVAMDDGQVFRTSVDPRLTGTEVRTKVTPGQEPRDRETDAGYCQYITTAVSKALHLSITEISQCRRQP